MNVDSGQAYRIPDGVIDPLESVFGTAAIASVGGRCIDIQHWIGKCGPFRSIGIADPLVVDRSNHQVDHLAIGQVMNCMGSGSSIGGDPGLAEVLLAWTSRTEDLVTDLVAVGVVVDGGMPLDV